MKKLLLLIFLFPALCFAQEAKPTNEMYAEIVGTSKLFSNKVTVEIDYGQATKFFHADKNRIVDEETGKVKVFNSMVDAMNFMGTMGWEFVQAYVITSGSTNVYHWLMKKELSDSDMKEYLPMIRGDIKKD